MKEFKYKILKPDDPFFKRCDHEWHPYGGEVSECLNPDGEYVEGYGHDPVYIGRQINDEICKKCNVKKSYLVNYQ